MKLSKPSLTTMHEYLLSMGEEWVKNTYGISGDEIDQIIYSKDDKLPTPERQKKKIEKAWKADVGKSKYRMLSSYFEDRFIWQDRNVIEERCANTEEKPFIEWSEKFLEDWTKMYTSLIDWDMKFNDNVMKSHGWSLGSRIINKTSSLTTDDDIHERMLQMLEKGKHEGYIYTNKRLASDKNMGKDGHGYADENFLENVETTDLDHLKSVVQDVSGDFGNTDPF